VLGRVVQPQDFQRALSTRPAARSAHFMLHHLNAAPARPGRKAGTSVGAGDAPLVPQLSTELSTGSSTEPGALVDDWPEPGRWLGMVVPKRHARRSVTRTLIKRQVREAMRLHQSGLKPGLWVVRLRAPFDKAQFPSAASDALRSTVRAELTQLFARIGRPDRRPDRTADRPALQPAGASPSVGDDVGPAVPATSSTRSHAPATRAAGRAR